MDSKVQVCRYASSVGSCVRAFRCGTHGFVVSTSHRYQHRVLHPLLLMWYRMHFSHNALHKHRIKGCQYLTRHSLNQDLRSRNIYLLGLPSDEDFRLYRSTSMEVCRLFSLHGRHQHQKLAQCVQYLYHLLL